MNTTQRFEVQRRQVLENIFTEKRLIETWRKVVKKQMRSLDIIDTHDYYDFNYNIENIAKHIRYEVINGLYQVNTPLIYKLEKKFGVCRHLMLPSPKDALVLQVLVDYIIEKGLNEPTKKAFFSRDRSESKLPHQLDSFGYDWRTLWRKFQKTIFNFSEDFDYLIVTDITNYFDSINLQDLRRIMASYVQVEEVVLDLLFKIIEEISWKPDYLPYSFKGLPTINLEAIRLLGHIMLFEIDEYLKNETNNNFVRWMDDINIGCRDEKRARTLLGNINDILKSRGLALNLSKTNIYTREEVQKHFLVEENKFIDSIEKKIKNRENISKDEIREIGSRFKRHIKNKNVLNWDKVTKRFFTISGKIERENFIKYGEKFFLKNPSLRQHILYFFENFKFKKDIYSKILNIYKELDFYDDLTFFQLTKFIVDYNIPYNKKGKEFIYELKLVYEKYQKDRFGYFCNLWFYGKYCEDHELLTLIENNKGIWIKDPFLSRQVIGILPRVYSFKKDKIDSLLNEQITSGFNDAAYAAKNIKKLLELKTLDNKIRPYLFYKTKPKKYPFYKFLIFLNILSNNKLNRKELIRKIEQNISDKWYLYHITKIGTK